MYRHPASPPAIEIGICHQRPESWNTQLSPVGVAGNDQSQIVIGHRIKNAPIGSVGDSDCHTLDGPGDQPIVDSNNLRVRSEEHTTPLQSP